MSKSVSPGDIDLDSLHIENFDKSETWDLSRMCVEFNIYEDISSPFIRGDMVVEDALALTTRLPIVGEETIKMKVKTTSVEGSSEYKAIEIDFKVIAVKQLKTFDQVRTSTYLLEFVSEQRISDLTKVVVDAFGPTKVSDMVKQVAKEYLNLEGDKIEIEDTSDDKQFVIPTMTPFETMAFLASESKSQDNPNVTNFFYFQNHEKTYFTTIEKLLKDGKIKEQYFTTPQEINDEMNVSLNVSQVDSKAGKKNPPKFRKMINFHYDHIVNVEENIKMGMYDNTVLAIDPILKHFAPVIVKSAETSEDTKTNFNYYDQFNDFQHTYKGRGGVGDISDIAAHANRLISEKSPYKELKGTSHIRYLITNEKQMKVNPKFSVYPRNRPEWLPWAISFGNQFRSIVCNLTIPGDSERVPGDLIYFDIHEFGATEDVKDNLNDYLSGAYFVTAVRHKYTRDAATRYVTIIQCVKNSYEKEIKNAPGKNK